MEENSSKLESIRNKHNLSLILLHGSQVDKKIHSKSDVDGAVVRNGSKDNLKLLELMKDLSQALETSHLDLSDITHADPLFLFSVMQKSKLLSGSQEDYNKLARTAFHKYNDYLPYLRMEKEFVVNRLESYVSN